MDHEPSCAILLRSYFVLLVVFGNFIVLNLFLAILLGNFNESTVPLRRASVTAKTPRRRPQLPMWAQRSLVRCRRRVGVACWSDATTVL